MPRVFVAALPDRPTTERLRAVPPDGVAGVRPVPPERRHVTLRFLGDVGDADVTDVGIALRDARLPFCTVRLGPETVRLGDRQIVVPASGVEPLAIAVRSATAGIGAFDDRPFYGHLTIARVRPGAGAHLTGLAVDGRFDVHEVALMASDLQPDGAVYRVIETFATSR